MTELSLSKMQKVEARSVNITAEGYENQSFQISHQLQTYEHMET